MENKVKEFLVFDEKGEQTKAVAFPKGVALAKPAEQLLAQAVRVYLTNQRQGNASAKTRAEVQGTTKKVYKQKGTGRARHGSMRAPIFKGGGVVGGPKPKDYTLKMNKKQKIQAVQNAFAMQSNQGNVVVLADTVNKGVTKTVQVAKLLGIVAPKNRKTMIVIGQDHADFARSARNLKNVCVTTLEDMNVYQILNHTKIVFFQSELDKFLSAYKNAN